jgi:hypothetical protein
MWKMLYFWKNADFPTKTNSKALMIKKFILLLTMFAALNSCTRDDICSEATPTTPLLIITFKDITNPLLAKTVSNLTIETDYDPSVLLLSGVSTDSIAIPLRTGDDNTRYRFTTNAGETDELIDVYVFNYARDDIYINRACGFKTIYTALSAREDDNGPIDWIIDLEVLNTTVENENEAHITIFH